jgi:S1-C subfamily serine protease
VLAAIGLGVAIAVVGRGLQTSDFIVGTAAPVVEPATIPSVVNTTPIEQSGSGARQRNDDGRHYTGVYMRSLTPQLASKLITARTDGVLIANVFPTGPADQAGIRPGDIYLAVDGMPVRRWEEVAAKNRLTPIGGTYVVTIERDGTVQNISVRVAEVTAAFEAWRASQHNAAQ